MLDSEISLWRDRHTLARRERDEARKALDDMAAEIVWMTVEAPAGPRETGEGPSV